MSKGDIYNLLAVDEKKKVEGTPIDVGDGITITVARFGNDRFQSYWDEITKPHRRAIENGTISKDDMENLLIDALAETILVGWEGIKVKNKNFPYSKANAVRLMTDLEEFRNIVSEEARKFQNYRAASMEADKGN